MPVLLSYQSVTVRKIFFDRLCSKPKEKCWKLVLRLNWELLRVGTTKKKLRNWKKRRILKRKTKDHHR
jgi:hypothetical protein